MFLLSLASAKRIGEFQALLVEMEFVVGDGSNLLSYVLELISKTDSATFTVP